MWRAPFLILISIAGVLLSVEWSTMATPGAKWRAVAMTSLSVVAVILLTFEELYAWAWGAVILGAVITAVITKNSAERATDGAYGVLYIAPACLALVWLIASPQGPGWTLMLFAVDLGRRRLRLPRRQCASRGRSSGRAIRRTRPGRGSSAASSAR